MSEFRKTVVDELVNLLESQADPKSITLEKVVVGVFYTGVKLNTGHGGVAFTPIQELPDAVCCPKSYSRMPASGHLTNQGLDRVLEYAKSPNPLKSAIGVAAINAVSHRLLFEDDSMKPKLIFDTDVMDLAELRSDDVVTMVGAFTPYIGLKNKVKTLNVVERNPLALPEGVVKLYPEDMYTELLPKSDVVIVSGAAVVNHTIDHVLDVSRHAREVILSGPTASMVPTPLFQRGVTVMGGVKINDADRMLQVVGEAGSGYTLYKECASRFAVRNRS